MSKRKSCGQMNTLFNYFQSPKQQKTTAEVQHKREDSDDELPQPKKKRTRILIADSDSDSENVEPTPLPKSEVNTADSDSEKTAESDTDNAKPLSTNKNGDSFASLQKFSFSKAETSNASTTSTFNKDTPIKKKTIETESMWLHEKLDFLKPEKRRDGNKNKIGHPDYDERTLYVPDDFLNKQTPAMRQWWILKMNHMDTVLFFKVGKFYELYHMDATVGVEYLGFSYMKGEFAHSGFPESAYGKMASALVEHGFKVARVEQTETPELMSERCKQMKKCTKYDKVVRREICQITSKGTCIYGTQLTDASKPTAFYMTAIAERSSSTRKRFGVCFVDTSIGVFNLAEFNDDIHCSRLLTLIAQYTPALVLTERHHLDANTADLLKKMIVNMRRETLSPESQFYSAQKTIEELHKESYFKDEKGNEMDWPPALLGLLTDGSPRPEYELALKSLGACMWYLKDCEIDIQVLSLGKFQIYKPIDNIKHKSKQEYMVLDSITIDNLKLRGGEGSLQKTLDYCSTPFGKRLLQQWICRPLCNIQKIRDRQEAVKELLNGGYLENARELLSKLPDLERQLAKLHTFGNKYYATDHPDSRAVFYEGKTYTKRKIFDLINTLNAFELASNIPNIFKDCKSSMLRNITQNLPDGKYLGLGDVFNFFENAFDHNQAKQDGTIIPQKGVDSEYDQAQDAIRSVQIKLEKYLEEQSKFFKCRVNYFGTDKKRFQLELPADKINRITEEYRLEGMKKGSKPTRRYSTPTTRELLQEMLNAEAERNKVLHGLNRKIFAKFSLHYDEWEQNIQCLMLLDCLCSFAKYASLHETCIPKVLPFQSKAVCSIENGVHPCINNVSNFIPNDCSFGVDSPNILLLTGPNMGGKSTLMRQVVLISIMAQMGSYVPAASCTISLVDRIFTRLGAHDNIIRNQSTAFVELTEASSILQHASENSFVLVDELGRGTSTHDGNAIATAYLRKLCDINCRTVFSTHYHTLVDFFSKNDRIQLGHMDYLVEESEGGEQQVTFLYKLAPGKCPKSFGFNVAMLAGLPKEIISDATEFAQRLEHISETRTSFRKLVASKIKCL